MQEFPNTRHPHEQSKVKNVLNQGKQQTKDVPELVNAGWTFENNSIGPGCL